MNQLEELLLTEYLERFDKPVINWKKYLFKQQFNFINDKSRFKAALCTRRAGKSFGIGAYLFKSAIENPETNQLYIALTRMSAKKIMWRDVLRKINRELGINAKANNTELSLELPNGSMIYLMGMDSTSEEKEKILGQKYKLAVVDESASFKQDLELLVQSSLRPTLADERGTLAMIGTPSSLLNSYFFKVTNGLIPEFKVHKWSAWDNPHIKKQWREELDFIEKNNPAFKETPSFKQMYLGEWFVDETKLIIPVTQHNLINQAPIGDYKHVIGVDLGYNDATAFTVTGYRAHDSNLYYFESYKKTKLIISDVAFQIKLLMKKYSYSRIVIDGANKQAIEELRQRHNLPFIETAEKTAKAHYLDMLKSDVITGVIKIVESECMPLIDEWSKLIWNDNAKKREENPACENHCSDSALYAWRDAINYIEKPKFEIPKPTDKAYEDYLEQLELEEFENKKSENIYGNLNNW